MKLNISARWAEARATARSVPSKLWLLAKNVVRVISGLSIASLAAYNLWTVWPTKFGAVATTLAAVAAINIAFGIYLLWPHISGGFSGGLMQDVEAEKKPVTK